MKVTEEDLDLLQRRLDEVKALVKAGESPFKALSYLSSAVKEVMFRKEKK